MKKPISFLLSLLLAVSLWAPAAAAHVSGAEAAEALEQLGLLRGDSRGLSLEREATRGEAAVMLLRLLGLEKAAAESGAACPFSDGGWAAAELGYAWQQGLVRGQSDGTFGTGNPVRLRDYLTMALRALGYTEDEDFTWRDSPRFSEAIGLTHGEYAEPDAHLLREDLALISYTALTLRCKGSDRPLAEELYSRGVLTADQVRGTRFAGIVHTGRQALSAAEIHERSASAVLFMTMYEKEEDISADRASGYGSGFLISPDGLAVMCWHELDGMEAAVATASDGKRYRVGNVLSYHPLWDYAVVRIDRTALTGETVRFFPYLDLGDSAAISAGDRVFTVSNPLMLTDTVTDGLVSHPSRVADDPDYPAIQITAPIASGSSGGPLLNRFGEVIGILFASFTRGENMNLAVPINAVLESDMSGEGDSIPALRDIEQAKKDSAAITVETGELTLAVGESRSVLVSSDYPGLVNLRFSVDTGSVVSCEWGRYQTKQSVPLKITGTKAGTTEISISFVGQGNPEAEATIRVTVTDGEA